MTSQALYEKIKANDPGGTAQEAADALAPVMAQKEKALDDRMISERRVFAILGMVSGEAFMAAIEASNDIPARVKAWFKPSEQGVDVLDPSAAMIIGMMVAGGVIGQAEADSLMAFGYEEESEYPGITATMVQNARDQVAKGL